MSIHLRPTAPVADRALLPDDPGLALALAQGVLDAPRMFNHHRGLWGYTGVAADGRPLTIQSTGIGGPSAAVVVDELIGLGVVRAIRVGTCTLVGAAATRAGGELGLGDLLIADAAVSADGTSRALGADGAVAGDAGLSRAMGGACPTARRGQVVSRDLFYGEGVEAAGGGAVAVDLETAAIFRLGACRGVRVACVLVVAGVVVDGRRTRIDDEELDAACLAAGRLGAAGLAAAAPGPAAA